MDVISCFLNRFSYWAATLMEMQNNLLHKNLKFLKNWKWCKKETEKVLNLQL